MTRRRPMNLQLSADDAPQIRPVQADNAGVNYGSGFIVFLIFFLKNFKRVFFRFTGIVNKNGALNFLIAIVQSHKK